MQSNGKPEDSKPISNASPFGLRKNIASTNVVGLSSSLSPSATNFKPSSATDPRATSPHTVDSFPPVAMSGPRLPNRPSRGTTSPSIAPAIPLSFSAAVRGAPSATDYAPAKQVSSVPVPDENSQRATSTQNKVPVPVAAEKIQDRGGESKKKDKQKKEEKASFFDQKYATTAQLGQKGTALTIRVNRFAIDHDRLPEQFHVYNVSWSRSNGHAIVGNNVKKVLMQNLLSHASISGARHQIHSDNIDTLVTGVPIQNLATTPFTVAANGVMSLQVNFQNQTGAPATSVTATISCSHILARQALVDYISGQQPSDFDFSEWMRACNIMVKHFAVRNAFMVGRNRVFGPPTINQATQTPVAMPSSLQPRVGFFSSVRPARKGLYLQLNSSAAAFFPPVILTDFLEDYFGKDRNNAFVFDKRRYDPATSLIRPTVSALVYHLQVRYRYNPPSSATARSAVNSVQVALQPGLQQGRLKRIQKLGNAANRGTFDHNGNTITFETYFNMHVLQPPATIQYPNLPVANVGTDTSPAWIPIELLAIESHQALSMLVPQRDMNVMANSSRRPPFQNVQLIEGTGHNLLDRVGLHNQAIISIKPRMAQLNGRMLALPLLTAAGIFVQNDYNKMRNGKWNLLGKRFAQGTNLSDLLVITVGNARGFGGNTMSGDLTGYGVLCVGAPRVQRSADTSAVTLSAAYDALANPKNVRLVLVVLPQHDIEEYAKVKQWGDLVRGVHTICITDRNVDKLQRPGEGGFRANLALKFNAKLGGANHAVQRSAIQPLIANGASTMVVGADVTHPGPTSVEFCPSIAAVVASTAPNCTRFPGSMRLQASRKEEIVDLKEMMIERLNQWRRFNTTLPSQILFYRDGVGENQFSMVKLKELTSIRAACQQVAGGEIYEPSITLVICTKRHQTRFYPTQHGTAPNLIDRNNNFHPGLVVDADPVRLPHYFDFYLQAHQPLQGTGRPCHYFVLENGMKLSPDQLQEVTFALSWVYATSTTPISMVAPAYYADKLCERGRCYLRPLLIGQHARRPNIVAILRNQNMQDHADDVKKDLVVQQLTNGSGGFWPQRGPNPCHPYLQDAMFYV